MSLIPRPSDAELLRRAQERQAARARGEVVWIPRVAPAPENAVLTTLPGAVTEAAADVGEKRVVLPWSTLVPDNRKYTIGRRRGRPVLRLTDEYADAKKRARNAAIAQIGEQPFRGPVSLRALVVEPNHQHRDIANFTKLVHDALEGTAYVNDAQLHRIIWERAGVDVDAPRAELLILPYLLPTQPRR